jgi:L,D-transpeptidase ErfK/SrfK
MRRQFLVFIFFIQLHTVVWAETFVLPESSDESVIGDLLFTTVEDGETLLDIARAFDIGYDQIIKANPDVDRWVPFVNQRIIIPSRYILPRAPREGVVLNLAELRLYYYPPKASSGADSVMTFPVSIGRMDWRTPLGRTKIAKKERNPVWIPTPSLRKEARDEDGIELPLMIPGGDPENPMGQFALRLGISNYAIHGTDERKAFGIGMRVTHGCIRLYPEDIEKLFALVTVGTPVTILDKPIKVGWRGHDLYLEVHRPIDPEEREADSVDASLVMEYVERAATPDTVIDDERVELVTELGNGIPVIVGHREPYH